MISLKKYSNIASFQSLIALFIMCLVLALLADNFMTADNFWNVLRQISVNVCISVGMTLVILTAGIDLSVGSILALSGAIAAGLLKNGLGIASANIFIGFTVFGVVIAGMLSGGALGFINGTGSCYQGGVRAQITVGCVPDNSLFHSSHFQTALATRR